MQLEQCPAKTMRMACPGWSWEGQKKVNHCGYILNGNCFRKCITTRMICLPATQVIALVSGEGKNGTGV